MMVVQLAPAVRSLLCGLGLILAPWAWAQTPGCEQANVNYRQALQAGVDDPASALPLLEEAVAMCPDSFHSWFLLGNAQRTVGRFHRAAAAYDKAVELADTPNNTSIAQAYQALAWHQDGRTCAASRVFESLVPRAGAIPPWLREPYEAFALDLERGGLDAESLTCALTVDKAARSLGVCPKVALRIPFAFDSAAIDASGQATVRALATALASLGGRFSLVGHTDARGAATYNQALSERRAVSVRDALEHLRPALVGRIDAGGEGESGLLALGLDEADHRLNRRVEVRVLCLET